MTEVEAIGVSPVDADEPCHLVELAIRGSEGRFDLADFTQADPGKPREDWQVPYAEKLVDPSGDWVEWDLWDGPGDEALWRGTFRLAFFFHYLDLQAPMATPFGEVLLPAPSPKPARLDEIIYEPP